MTKILLLLVLLALLNVLRNKENFSLFEFGTENIYDEKDIKYYKTPYFCLDYQDLVRT